MSEVLLVTAFHVICNSSFDSKCLHHSMHLPYCTDLKRHQDEGDSNWDNHSEEAEVITNCELKRLAMQLQEELHDL
jgi:hypothetical protein